VSKQATRPCSFLVAVNHPSQFHMFKNLARKLIDDGHHCVFFIQQRGIIEDLVKGCGFEYRFAVSPLWREKLKGKLGIYARGIIHIVQSYFRILRYCLENKVDIMMGTDVPITHVAKLLGKISLVFTDDDHYFIEEFCKLAMPFATHVVASNVVDLGKWKQKIIGYDGNQKTAYIHPAYFKADRNVLAKYGLEEDRFTIIRLVTFGAMHDAINQVQTGLNAGFLEEIIPFLSSIGKVVINAEQGEYPEFSEYCLKLDPSDMHSLLYYARLLLTDSQSMHVEAGLLGTPSIRTNKWVDDVRVMSVVKYMEDMCDLGISISPQKPDVVIQKVKEYSQDGVKQQWAKKRDKFFRENTNLTDFLYWFVTEYPESLHEYKQDPQRVLKRFRHDKVACVL